MAKKEDWISREILVFRDRLLDEGRDEDADILQGLGDDPILALLERTQGQAIPLDGLLLDLITWSGDDAAVKALNGPQNRGFIRLRKQAPENGGRWVAEWHGPRTEGGYSVVTAVTGGRLTAGAALVAALQHTEARPLAVEVFTLAVPADREKKQPATWKNWEVQILPRE